MKAVALEKELRKKGAEDLEKLANAMDVCIEFFPRQLVSEAGFQFLGTMVKLILEEKKGGQEGGGRCC